MCLSCYASLVGDYRFAADAPGANEIRNRLPDMVIGERNVRWMTEPETDFGHGVSTKVSVPNPVLCGYLPVGGTGGAPSNNWALCWTRGATEIPQHPDLDLGDSFTLWLRFAYVGAAPGAGSGRAVVLLERRPEAPGLGFRLECVHPGFVKLTASRDGTAAEEVQTSAARMRMEQGVWYDLAVVFDRGRVSFWQTEISESGPGSTMEQTVTFASTRTVAPGSGPLRVAPAMGMLERLRIYRGEALDGIRVASLSAGVRMPVWRSAGELRVGTNTQLFLDDDIVESRTGLTRRLHSVKKHASNPVLAKSSPFEGKHLSLWSPVLWDPEEKLYKLWYVSHGGAADADTEGEPDYHFQAVSRDGIHWDKPVLNITGAHNRISVPTVSSYGTHLQYLWKDADAPDPQQRYKAFGLTGYLGFFTSPDGLSWAYRGLTAYGTDDTPANVRVPWLDRYVHVVRPTMTGKPPGYRTIAVGDSSGTMDGVWPWKLLFTPDATDRASDPDLQFYGMPMSPYQECLIGFLWIYHSGAADTIETQLAFSRDGRNWIRPGNRQPVIAPGQPGEWDAGMVYGTCLLVIGDEIRVYYHGWSGTHSAVGTGAIGFGTLRLDGFASLRAGAGAGAGAGTLTTKPFVCEGRTLRINADVPSGQVRVEVQDKAGRPLSGFRLRDCRPFSGDAVRHRFAWQGKSDLTEFLGREIRLHFEVLRGDLYSFRLAP